MAWIIIPNWDGPEGFQHYKDRTPRWVKNYTELLHDDAYLQLTLVQRGVLHGLWLEYASARRQIPDSTLTVSRRLGQRVTRATLDALNHAGFITYAASRVIAPCYTDASLEKSREELEENTPPTPPRGESRRRRQNGPEPIPLAVAWLNFINGQAWDDVTSEEAIREELERLRHKPSTIGEIDTQDALHAWIAKRAERYGHSQSETERATLPQT